MRVCVYACNICGMLVKPPEAMAVSDMVLLSMLHHFRCGTMQALSEQAAEAAAGEPASKVVVER